jgi:hypothetical protein
MKAALRKEIKDALLDKIKAARAKKSEYAAKAVNKLYITVKDKCMGGGAIAMKETFDLLRLSVPADVAAAAAAETVAKAAGVRYSGKLVQPQKGEETLEEQLSIANATIRTLEDTVSIAELVAKKKIDKIAELEIHVKREDEKKKKARRQRDEAIGEKDTAIGEKDTAEKRLEVANARAEKKSRKVKELKTKIENMKEEQAAAKDKYIAELSKKVAASEYSSKNDHMTLKQQRDRTVSNNAKTDNAMKENIMNQHFRSDKYSETYSCDM